MADFSAELFKELDSINKELVKGEPLNEDQCLTLLLASLIEEEGNGSSKEK